MNLEPKVKTTIEEWAKSLNRDTKKLAEEWKSIYELPLYANMQESERQFEALRVLKARLSRGLMALANTKETEVVVIYNSSVREVGLKDGSNAGVASAVVYAKIDGEKRFGRITGWREAATMVANLEKGVFYKVNLQLLSKRSTDSHFEFGVPEGVIFERLDRKQIDLNEIVYSLPKIAYKDIEKFAGQSGLFAIQGTVLRHYVGSKGDGREFGVYNIQTDDMSFDDVRKTGGLSVWLEPAQIIWDNDSELWFVGSFSKSKKDDSIFMSGMAVIPIRAVGIGDKQPDMDIPPNLQEERILEEVKMTDEDKEGEDFFT